MENGLEDKNGEKVGKTWFAPIENGKKWPKNTEKMENRANFPFFRHFILDRGKKLHDFPTFSPFLSVGPFSIDQIWHNFH